MDFFLLELVDMFTNFFAGSIYQIFYSAEIFASDLLYENLIVFNYLNLYILIMK